MELIAEIGSTLGVTRQINADSGSTASTWSYQRTIGSGTNHTEGVTGWGTIANTILLSQATRRHHPLDSTSKRIAKFIRVLLPEQHC